MLRKYVPSVLLFLLFEAVAVALWIAKDNLFYLLNFSYIGGCLALGTVLFTAGKRYARHFVQLAVGSYMLLYLGIISRENMQIEGFWYYLFLGVFEAATIHYAVAKIFGPLVLRAGMARLCLLDSYGAGFSALQAAEKGPKRKVRHFTLCDVCAIPDSGFLSVFDENRSSGGDHVPDVSCRECSLLYFRYCTGFCI